MVIEDYTDLHNDDPDTTANIYRSAMKVFNGEHKAGAFCEGAPESSS